MQYYITIKATEEDTMINDIIISRLYADCKYIFIYNMPHKCYTTSPHRVKRGKHLIFLPLFKSMRFAVFTQD